MTSTSHKTSGARYLMTAAAFVIVVAGMQAAQSIVVPFLLSIFLAILCGPLLHWLQAKGAPTALALLLVISLLAALCLAVVTLVGASVTSFTNNIGNYTQSLQALVKELVAKLSQWGIASPNDEMLKSIDPGSAMSFIGGMLSSLSGLFGNGFLILLTTIFILLEASGFPAKLDAISDRSQPASEQFYRIVGDIRRYMALKTWISLATGVTAYLFLTIMGIDYAALWGLMIFLLNFVPNIGSFLAAVPPVLLAAIQPGLGLSTALWTAVGLGVINTIVGSVIEPRVMGRGLGLSTLVVFLSLVFWGWVFGLAGMLLSAPLTMAVKISLEGKEDTRWLAILLSSDAAVEAGRK